MSLGTGQVWSGGEVLARVAGEDATRGQEQKRSKGTGKLQSDKKRGEGVGSFCPYWNAKWSLQDEGRKTVKIQ